MPPACFLLLEITDVHLTKGWLGEIADQIRDGTAKPDEKVISPVFMDTELSGLFEIGASVTSALYKEYVN